MSRRSGAAGELASCGSDEPYRVLPYYSGGVDSRRDLIAACAELVPSAGLELPPGHQARSGAAGASTHTVTITGE